MVSITNPTLGAMLPPATPLLVTKRPSYALKRDSSYLDTDDESGLTMTTKKLKVAFDPKVDVRIMDESWNNKSMDLVREEVRISIERHIVHDDEQYLRLVHVIRQDPFESDAISGKLLMKYLVAIESKISRLKECPELVSAIMDCCWLGRDEIFVGEYIKFILALTTAHAKWLQTALDRTVACLSYLPSSQGALPGETTVPRSVMFTRIHSMLKTFLRQIPAASNCLIKSLRAEYPNDLATLRSYQQYQRHMLVMCEYADEIKSEIMATIIQRVVALDVQIQQDIEELEEEAEDQLLHRKTIDTDDADESDAESVSSSEETVSEEEEQLKELRLKVAKMDATMDLLFCHYDPVIRDGSHADHNEGFQQLLSHFSTYVLPNRTRHAQFLLFHFSQISLDHITAFAQQCIEQGFANSASLQRYTAIAYLSSFVARGTHVPRDTVQEIFSILCEYLEQMRKRYEPSCRGPDRQSYALYYAVAQAILYVFCFRWKDLVDEDMGSGSEEDDVLADNGELTWMPEIKAILQKNIFGALNPLKICAPAIVSEFANIARHVRFIEVISKVESNKRIRLGQTFSYYGLGGGLDVGRRETALDRKAGDAHHQLEPYFPFDPYHLPHSKRWLDGDYNSWKLPRGMKREDEEDTFHDDSDEDSDDESLADIDHDVSLEVLSNSS